MNKVIIFVCFYTKNIFVVW